MTPKIKITKHLSCLCPLVLFEVIINTDFNQNTWNNKVSLGTLIMRFNTNKKLAETKNKKQNNHSI